MSDTVSRLNAALEDSIAVATASPSAVASLGPHGRGWIGLFALAQGDDSNAVRLLEGLARDLPGFYAPSQSGVAVRVALAAGYRRLGRVAASDSLLALAEVAARVDQGVVHSDYPGTVDHFNLALIAAVRNDVTGALDHLGDLVEDDITLWWVYPWALRTSLLARVREQPEFWRLIEPARVELEAQRRAIEAGDADPSAYTLEEILRLVRADLEHYRRGESLWLTKLDPELAETIRLGRPG